MCTREKVWKWGESHPSIKATILETLFEETRVLFRRANKKFYSLQKWNLVIRKVVTKVGIRF